VTETVPDEQECVRSRSEALRIRREAQTDARRIALTALKASSLAPQSEASGRTYFDFTHKVTTNLIRNHEALVFESLNVKGMSKTKLSKSIHDTAFGEIRKTG